MNIDPRYKRGKIYTIRSHKTPLVYVGSTIEPLLSNRLSGHRSKFKAHKRGDYGRCTVFDIFEIDKNCYIELYEEYPCDSKEQLDKREGEVIRELDCVNRNVAGRTDKEYREENREQIRAWDRQYYAENKQKRNKKDRRYRENNKEKIKAQCNQYYHNNKEIIKIRRNQKFQCECGSNIRIGEKSRHMKTKKHQEYMDFMYN